jgi:DNA-binding GntR family transcriptional regulator
LTFVPRVVTAQQAAYEYIRERILDGTLRGGDLLKPDVIAGQVAISRMPVREALRQLDAEGLVTLRLNRTAVVTNVTTSEISDLFEMRAALETLTAAGIAANVDERALRELEQLRCAMDEASGRSNTVDWLRCHMAFHDRLLDLCGRPRLASEIVRLRSAVQPYLLLYVHVYPSTETPGMEHKTLLSAIRTGDVTLIEVCFREHVLSAGRGVIRFLNSKSHSLNESGAGKTLDSSPLNDDALGPEGRSLGGNFRGEISTS